MSEAITLARPYAKAVFSLAQQQGAFADWSAVLQRLALIVSDPRIADLAGNPRVPAEALADAVSDIAKQSGEFSDEASHLVKLLADNGRLAVLPEIAAHYEVLRNDAERVVDAELRTASEPSKAQQDAIQKALAKRLGREVKLNVVIDETLIGGALVRAGDLVIDGTVKSRLARLDTALTTA